MMRNPEQNQTKIISQLTILVGGVLLHSALVSMSSSAQAQVVADGQSHPAAEANTVTDQKQKLALAPTFDLSFLGGAAISDEMAQMMGGSKVLPGVHQVDVMLNGFLLARRPVTFQLNETTKRVEPCITVELLQAAKFNFKSINLSEAEQDPKACINLPALVDKASVFYEPSFLQLLLSIPQANLLVSADGYVDPVLWDSGVTAAYSNYNVVVNHSRQQNSKSATNTYVGLQNGINVAGWRFRNDASLSLLDGGEHNYRSSRSFIERDVDILRSQLSIGDQYTDGTLFDSVRFRGVQLASDDAMLPQSLVGYAPVIRGQAASNATVEVRQNGYSLYKTTVPPGSFALRDIRPSGSNGDLEIIVTEADGTERITYQAFSQLPLMVRQGRLKYSASLGRYQSGGTDTNQPKLLTSSVVYGLADNTTLVGGALFSSGYQAMNIGVGTNTPVGALSLDVTHSRSEVGQDRNSGQSIRVLYAKTFTGTNTNFTLAAYRYSTEGYRTLSNHISEQNNVDQGNVGLYSSGQLSRSRIDLSITQDLGESSKYGSFYLNTTHQTYWGRSGASRSTSLGYSSNVGEVSFSLGFSQYRDSSSDIGNNTSQNQVQLTLNLPLGNLRNTPRLNATTTYNKMYGSQTRLGINGSLSNSIYYNFNAGHSSQTRESNFSAGMGGALDVADFSVQYNYAKAYQSASLGLSGGLVLHRGGLNLSRNTGDSFTLLKTEGVKDSKLAVQGGSSFGYNGYAVLPGSMPYRVNTVALNTTNVDSGVELEDTSKQVVPRRGAIVLAAFKGSRGLRVELRLRQADGKPIPFGATVKSDAGRLLGLTDMHGRLLGLFNSDKETLHISWSGEGDTQYRCRVDYAAPEVDKALNYQSVTLPCLPIAVDANEQL